MKCYNTALITRSRFPSLDQGTVIPFLLRPMTMCSVDADHQFYCISVTVPSPFVQRAVQWRVQHCLKNIAPIPPLGNTYTRTYEKQILRFKKKKQTISLKKTTQFLELRSWSFPQGLFYDFGEYLRFSVISRYVENHKCTVKGNTFSKIYSNRIQDRFLQDFKYENIDKYCSKEIKLGFLFKTGQKSKSSCAKCL